ncbi:glycosyl hydrolase [Rathayibacter caricis DSM 15933]|uniref:Glycosyl hydrolase n=1 Tax=Rathayibacter caricis DSM 15933 TaxID=1328867 RepID=A0A2T4UQU6_9MICO|nr:glycoside hydrolase family 3 C-terminal domain-containing protein [Rathayibacter caricis]PTL71901.1 glycosyl hydrolase [Rathayibacter caricis DSM 15933]
MNDPSSARAGSEEIEAALALLTLHEKVTLLTGRDFWSTAAIDRIGLRSMVLSDGPSGVRGPLWDERDPSLNLPSATALSATFDPALARRYGAAAAAEARRKNVDVVLGPTINLHRSPFGGRHFESFSEDPVLTAELASAYVTGVQEHGVAATLKHYIANDSETDRFTVDVQVDERTLRELYLLPFEDAIVKGGAWAIMSSYNSVNGVTVTENELLETPLSTEWGFDGVVISDWTAVRSLTSAQARQDLVMPGPDGPWGAALVTAVEEGRIPEAAVDEKVRRILLLAQRVGAFGSANPSPSPEVENGPSFARSAASAGMVLLENRDELPWDASQLSSVAVIGNNASAARTQGGGSATVIPEYTVSPLDGLRAALPGVDVRYSLGATTQIGLVGLPRQEMINPVTGGEGAHLTFRDGDGTAIFEEDRFSTELFWFEGDVPVAATRRIDMEFEFSPLRNEAVEFGLAAAGHGRIWIDGDLALDEEMGADGQDLGASLSTPAVRTVVPDLQEGRSFTVRIEYEPALRADGLGNALSMNVGTQPLPSDEDELIAAAAEAARTSDVALVVVGTNARVESEGFDRASLALPGRQDDLVRAVAAANPRTVVLVNAGAPVTMPWRTDVAAVLVGWFGGQELGNALADVLLGTAEPSGRLPTTWPEAEDDLPVWNTTPIDGALPYSEGIHVGYRAWLRSETPPAYWFGHGLGYSTAELVSVTAPPAIHAGEELALDIQIRGTGSRNGRHVVLAFAEKRDSQLDRPVRWLVGFTAIDTIAGETTTARICFSSSRLSHWAEGWKYESGEYVLRVGTTADELPLEAVTVLTPAE